MKKVPIYYWRHDHDFKPGKRVKTRHAMSEADAMERLRGLNPEKVEPPFMVLDIAETDAERTVGTHGPAGRKG
jgi:hypothetical protein